MNDVIADAAFSQKFRCFQTMLLRIQLKINIVKQSDNAPVFGFITIGRRSLSPIPTSRQIVTQLVS